MQPSRLARLVPGSGLQFLDIEIPTGPLALNYGRFVEDVDADEAPVLIPLQQRPDQDDLDWHPVSNRSLAPDEALWLTGYNGLEPFLDAWVPLPYLRRLGGRPDEASAFDSGPANWCRVYIAQPATDLRQAASLAAVIAFDTRLDAGGRLDQDQYLAPNADDVRLASEFRLATDPTVLAPLLAEAWLDSWLAQRFAAYRARLAGGEAGRAAMSPGRFRLEHTARYLSLLRVLEEVVRPPAVRFADTFAEARRSRSVGIDLAIDVGDDRTAALLIEQRAGHGGPDLAGAETLRLRDLSNPTVIHPGAFRTLGEFDRPDFGSVAASRLSGRPDAFYWPSLLRVGEEAGRLSMRTSAVPGLTGLGNLRAALGDKAVRSTVWRFSRDDTFGAEPGPFVAGELLSHVTEDGSVIGAAEGASVPALRPRFSPTAVLSMFFAEIALQALSQINAPAAGAEEGEARHLQRIVVTCPAAATDAERRHLQSCAESGIALIWKAFGWGDTASAATPGKPRVSLGLDAGLSAQLLYLFDEVQGRFRGNARQFVGLTRGADSTTAGVGSLTVASLDLAGGATGLAIVDYDLGREGAVHPQIVLADRSTIAGGSLIDSLVTAVILPAIAEALAASGHADADACIEALLTGTGTPAGSTGAADRHLGERLLHRIVRPAATALMELYRDLPQGVPQHGLRLFSLPALVARGGGRLAPLDDRIEALAKAGGGRDFRMAKISIGLQPRAIARLFEEHLDGLVTRVAEVVRHYGCDLLLLTGPYAALDDVRRLLLLRLPLAPHRIVNLSERRLGLVGPLGDDQGDRTGLRLVPLIGASLAASAVLEGSGLALITDGLNPPSKSVRGAGLAALGRRPISMQRLGRTPGDGEAEGTTPAASGVLAATATAEGA